MSNLDRYKDALDALIKRGTELELAMQVECFPDEVRKQLVTGGSVEEADRIIARLPKFTRTYQAWYTEALALIRQVLPDRLANFVGHYEVPKGRKELSNVGYRIEDYIHGLQRKDNFGKIVVPRSGAYSHLQAQVEIVKAAAARFESALFDIRQMEQADLFDSELDAARSLNKHGYARAAGAMAGVVLEHHLAQVCINRSLKVAKKNPGISVLNDTLKNADAIDVPQWRGIQRLGDIRNLCDHPKEADPTGEQIQDLLDGVAKVTKTVF